MDFGFQDNQNRKYQRPKILWFLLKKNNNKKNRQIDMYDFPVTDCTQELLSFSGNHEHLKNFRTVDCVLANYNKVQDTQANLKTTN